MAGLCREAAWPVRDTATQDSPSPHTASAACSVAEKLRGHQGSGVVALCGQWGYMQRGSVQTCSSPSCTKGPGVGPEPWTIRSQGHSRRVATSLCGVSPASHRAPCFPVFCSPTPSLPSAELAEHSGAQPCGHHSPGQEPRGPELYRGEGWDQDTASDPNSASERLFFRRRAS